MGLDALIYCKTTDGEFPNYDDVAYAAPGWAVKAKRQGDSHAPEDATHEVDVNGARYYGEGYERGPWPRLAAALMALFASTNVEKVWYGSDCDDVPEVVVGDVLFLCGYFMRCGHRPYRDSFK